MSAGLQAWVRRWGWRPWHYAILVLVHLHFFRSHGLATGRDAAFVFYPWADALRRTILEYHQFPWWNPWAMGGQPLFADPGSIAAFMPDTLLVLIFGTVTGLKLTILLYVAAGYEGARVLCRHLFGDDTFVEGASLIPALIPALALHFNEGHIVFVIFYLLPWMIWLSLTWERSRGHALAFGAVIGCYLLSYIHYTVIMTFSLLGPLVVLRVARMPRSRDVWLKAALVACAALGLSLLHIGTALAIIMSYPRREPLFYPIAAPLTEVVRAFLEPLQNRDTPANVSGLMWWEIGAYVGLPALLLAYEGFRRDGRRLWPLYAGVVACLLLAWNNRDAPFPSTWLHEIPLWKNMVVIPRWSLFASFFILVGAVHGLTLLRRAGHERVATALALVVVADLAFASAYAYRDTFNEKPPSFGGTGGQPRTVDDGPGETWAHERQNLVSLGALCTLLGWGRHYPARQQVGSQSYRGEAVGSQPVVVEEWTPSHFTLFGTPGDLVTLNMNPSSYWLMNGRRLFPTYRAFEIDKPFQATVPPSGRMRFEARDPHATSFAVAQALFAVAAFVLFRTLRRSPSRAS